MTPSPHIAEPKSTAAAQAAGVDEILDRMSPKDVEALAALSGAPAGVAELAFNAFPTGTRMWVITYGLASEQSDSSLAITDLGRQAIEHAAERCPEPYQDLSLSDVMASTREAVAQLVEQTGVEIREPSVHRGRGETVAAALRRRSRQLVERSQASVMGWVESSRTRRHERLDSDDETVGIDQPEESNEPDHADHYVHPAP